MSRSDIEHAHNAQQHIAKLREHLTRGDLADETIFDAVCMRLSAAIESIASISEANRLGEFDDSWTAIWSVRNRIAHGYIYVDDQIIHATVNEDLPEFEAALERLARALDDDDAVGSSPG